ncbi:MAG: hypothetical protein Q4B54_04130 [Coriobacteriales bacterium]|nr:hypothetical protein [Coriobacteriales bacterium]
MGRRKNQTRGVIWMLCASFALTCMVPHAKGALADEALHKAEDACTGETQLWIQAPDLESATDARREDIYEPESEPGLEPEPEPDFEAEPVGELSPLEGKRTSTAQSVEAVASDQLRQSMRVPAAQDRPLARTADALTNAGKISSLLFASGLALAAGLLVRGEAKG